jgi:four helix bundle protein
MESKYHFKFEDLKVYQKAMDFGETVDVMVREFPSHELYALSSQFRRAADSIALNLAEGYPGSDAQFVKHINYSLFSSNECVAAAAKALRRKYIDQTRSELVRAEITDLQKMLTSLRKIIKNRMSR